MYVRTEAMCFSDLYSVFPVPSNFSERKIANLWYRKARILRPVSTGYPPYHDEQRPISYRHQSIKDSHPSMNEHYSSSIWVFVEHPRQPAVKEISP